MVLYERREKRVPVSTTQLKQLVAAAMISGRSANGRKEGKVKNTDQSYRDWEKKNEMGED